MKRRIAMFLDTSFPPDSRVENEALLLINHGFEVSLFSVCYKKMPKFEDYKGIRVYRHHGSNLLYRLSALAYTFPFFRWMLKKAIAQFIEEFTPDYLHIHDMPLAQTVMAVNKGKVQVVLDLHENRPVIMQSYPHLQIKWKRWLISPKRWAIAQTKLMQKANRVVLVTEEAKEQAIKEGVEAQKILVLPNTISLEVFLKYPIDESLAIRFVDKYVLLYLGDTGLRRGLVTVIQALVDLRKEIPNIHLVIVGKSSEDKVLIQLASDLGVLDLISFEGWQDVSRFPSYIKIAKIGLCPLLRNLHHDTTYANKIFQYMAFGLPQIVSDCPAQENLIKKIGAGLVFKSGDCNSFRDTVLVFKNMKREEILEIKDRSRKEVTYRYNWRESGMALINYYQEYHP